MSPLPTIGFPVFNALLSAPLAWQTPAEIAKATGRNLDATLDLLCDLDVAGWIAVWERDGGPLVTLTSLAAELLDARLVECGSGETPKWLPTDEPEPSQPRSKNVCAGSSGAKFDFLTDPSLPPDLLIERSECSDPSSTKSRTRSRIDELPRPTLLVGLGLSPWPGPAVDPNGKCPACGGGPLTSRMYCLCCDRWGAEGTPEMEAILTATAAAQPVPEKRFRWERKAKGKQQRDGRKHRRDQKVQTLQERERQAHDQKKQERRLETARLRQPRAERPWPPSPSRPQNADLGFAAPPKGAPVAR